MYVLEPHKIHVPHSPRLCILTPRYDAGLQSRGPRSCYRKQKTPPGHPNLGQLCTSHFLDRLSWDQNMNLVPKRQLDDIHNHYHHYHYYSYCNHYCFFFIHSFICYHHWYFCYHYHYCFHNNANFLRDTNCIVMFQWKAPKLVKPINWLQSYSKNRGLHPFRIHRDLGWFLVSHIFFILQ